jgi:hypothetical protein
LGTSGDAHGVGALATAVTAVARHNSSSPAAVATGTEEAIFLSWNPLGAARIVGVQGRYFLPLSMFLCLLGRRQGMVAAGIGMIALLVIVVIGDVAALHAVDTYYPQ